MLPNPHAQPSRWTAFVARWDERLQRFRQSLDPFSHSADPRMQAWAIVLLSIGVVALAALIVFGAIWITDHHRWALIIPLLKVLKLFGLGVAIVTALLFRDRFAKMPLLARMLSRDAAPPKG